MTSRSLPLVLSLSAVCSLVASCTSDDLDAETDVVEDEVVTCTATNTETGVCGVGVSSDGYLAVSYRNAWWSVAFGSGQWVLANNVTATPLDIVPTQTVTFSNPCDGICNSCSGQVGSAQAACQQACNSCRATSPPTSRTEVLQYSVAVSGLTYSLRVDEQSVDTQAKSVDSATETRSQRSLEFRIGLQDPDDGNAWSVSILPKRTVATPIPEGEVTVTSGTYGGNAGAPHGNATASLAAACDHKPRCTYAIEVGVLGDPVPNVTKDFVAEWRCGSSALRTAAPPEANGSIVNLACGQEAVNELVTDGTISTGGLGTIVSSSNTQYSSEVELMGAVKTGATSSPELVARTNAALNRSLNAALPAASRYQDHYIPQAIQTLGSVSHIAPRGSSTGIYDLDRYTQFYMDNRKGNAGWSTRGDGERPQAESEPKKWSWRHTIFDYTVRFPFLGGICGLEVGVNSFIGGSLTYGRQSCFDGLATTIDAQGQMQFGAGAHGGFGCDLFFVAASAGLGSRVLSGFEFNTRLETAPPKLVGAVDLYSDVEFEAYFAVRVLARTKKWGKVARARLFQKHSEYRMAPTTADPARQLCNVANVPTGTCLDSLASCDDAGRCIRYDFASSDPAAPPTRVDTGACLVRADRAFGFSVEGRQYIPLAIPGLPSTVPGKLCPSTPADARDAWLNHLGLGANESVPTWPEPFPTPTCLGTCRFSGNERYADTRPDRLRKTGLRWVGTIRQDTNTGITNLETSSWEPSTSWSMRFDQSGCVIDARRGNVELVNRVAAPSGGVSKTLVGDYPFNVVDPPQWLITSKIQQSLVLHDASISGRLARFKLRIVHTNFPWYETILNWKGRAWGLRDWASACPGPSLGAFGTLNIYNLEVELRDDADGPKVFVDGIRVEPDTFPARITGPSGC